MWQPAPSHRSEASGVEVAVLMEPMMDSTDEEENEMKRKSFWNDDLPNVMEFLDENTSLMWNLALHEEWQGFEKTKHICSTS